jgi:hypothetical protein
MTVSSRDPRLEVFLPYQDWEVLVIVPLEGGIADGEGEAMIQVMEEMQRKRP